MSSSNQSWSIVIFGYNESGTINEVVEDTIEFFTKASIAKFEIIIVDDGSTDGMREMVKKLSDEKQFIKAVIHDENNGIGHALRSGYHNASFENVCAIPADGQFNINEMRSIHTKYSSLKPKIHDERMAEQMKKDVM